MNGQARPREDGQAIMTDIDPEDEIRISAGDGRVTAMMPLTGPVNMKDTASRGDSVAGARGGRRPARPRPSSG